MGEGASRSQKVVSKDHILFLEWEETGIFHLTSDTFTARCQLSVNDSPGKNEEKDIAEISLHAVKKWLVYYFWHLCHEPLLLLQWNEELTQ